MTTNEQVEPSKNFLRELADFKAYWFSHDELNHDKESMERRYHEFLESGYRKGLSHDFIMQKIYEIRTNCNECNHEITIDRRHERLCPTCNEVKEKVKWKEWQDKAKRAEDPIRRYGNFILGIVPDYEISYEENKEMEKESWKKRREILDKEFDEKSKLHWPKPEGMTKTQRLKEKRRKRRLAIEERKEREHNDKLWFESRPQWLIQKRIDKIPCACTAEEIRAGRFCKTCKLLVRVNEYMQDLFKNASEGRSSIV